MWGKDKLNTIEVPISMTLFDLYISHSEFVSANNVLRQHCEIKESLENPETSIEYTI